MYSTMFSVLLGKALLLGISRNIRQLLQAVVSFKSLQEIAKIKN